MSDTHLKRLVILIALAAAILVSSLYLMARPMPPPLIPAAPSVGTVATTSPSQPGAVSSTQPKITWSQNQVEVILSPGESTSKDLSFTSSLNLQNAVVQAVPEIAGFLTIQGNSFGSVPAGQPQSIHVPFLIPNGTILGTYEGTVHVRIGSLTLPQTLKVRVNVWTQVMDPTTGLKFLIPPLGGATRTTVNTSTPGQTFIDFQLQDTPQGEFASEFGITIYSNPDHLGLYQWFEQNIDIDSILAANHTFQEQQLFDGSDALVFVGPTPAQYLDVGTPVDYAYKLSAAGDQVISIKRSTVNTLFDLGYSQAAITNLENQILGTMHF